MVKKENKKYWKKIYDSLNSDHYINRELSWMEFNRRVLNEAVDSRTPLFERLRFLSIYTSNLDEFVMKRVGGLKKHIQSATTYRSIDGLSPQEQLKLIRQGIISDSKLVRKTYTEIVDELTKQGIYLLSWKELKGKDKDFANEYFKSNVFPILTPLSVDPGHPFPFISNLSYSLGITLRTPGEDEILFSRLKIPKGLPHWVLLPSKDGKRRFLSIEDMIVNNLDLLFPKMQVVKVMPFKVTRNADYDHDDEDAEDLLEMVEETMNEQRFAKCIRLEYIQDGDPWMVELLKKELELEDDDLYPVSWPIDFSNFAPILKVDIPELSFSPWVPISPRAILEENGNLFNVINKRDLLVHHPYESFSASVERFIVQASTDPNVLAIKMTLYRTGDDSPFIKALIEAASRGKQVVCLVELKARFDERRNIAWAQKLEDAGVHVVYGILGLKTHTKIALVVRRESNNSIKSYCHIGTGNYHSGTSKLYTDFGVLTANKEITDEIVELFNYLTGRSLKTDYRQLLVSPINMKSSFLDLIKKEVKNKKEGKRAFIFAKMNSLEDVSITNALYEASCAGVNIILVVRGFCCLRPGLKGVSENITVVSIVGRFLEHSRIFYFAAGKSKPLDGKFFIGSADWMYRNLHNRVECITPIYDQLAKKKLWDFIEVMLADDRQTWVLKADGGYRQNQPTKHDSKATHHVMMARSLKDKEDFLQKG